MKEESTTNAELWVVRHKGTKELWVAASGKTSWKKAHHAKSAWKLCKGKNEVSDPSFTSVEHRWGHKVRTTFDNQDIYELVNTIDQYYIKVENLVEQKVELLRKFENFLLNNPNASVDQFISEEGVD